MKLREGWFKRQVDYATKSIESWPAWMRREAKIEDHKGGMMSEHYSDGKRWSHLSHAWILEESWNSREEVARLSAENDKLKAELELLRACLRKGLGPFVDDPGGFESWYLEATALVQEAS